MGHGLPQLLHAVRVLDKNAVGKRHAIELRVALPGGLFQLLQSPRGKCTFRADVNDPYAIARLRRGSGWPPSAAEAIVRKEQLGGEGCKPDHTIPLSRPP